MGLDVFAEVAPGLLWISVLCRPGADGDLGSGQGLPSLLLSLGPL